jgi:hypothetical protein
VADPDCRKHLPGPVAVAPLAVLAKSAHPADRSLAEIAEILDLDIGTVKAHLFRAIAKLREELHDLYGFHDRGRK